MYGMQASWNSGGSIGPLPLPPEIWCRCTLCRLSSWSQAGSYSLHQQQTGGGFLAELMRCGLQALVSYKAPTEEHELDKTRRRTLDAAVPDDERQGQVAKTLEADMLESSVEDLTCPICMVLSLLLANSAYTRLHCRAGR